jgi:hypothetical protein
MNQLTELNDVTDNTQFTCALKTADREQPELSPNPILLISQIFFAVFVIGFMGYFFDRLLASRVTKLRHRRA